MADTVTKVDFYTLKIAHRPGAAAEVLAKLAAGGANFLGMWGYHAGPGQGNLELIPESGAVFRKAANKAGIDIGEKKVAFVVSGKDRRGAMAQALGKLGAAGINVQAAQAMCAGGKYAGAIYVDPADVAKAGKALKK